jgi:hypothetical protein
VGDIGATTVTTDMNGATSVEVRVPMGTQVLIEAVGPNNAIQTIELDG